MCSQRRVNPKKKSIYRPDVLSLQFSYSIETTIRSAEKDMSLDKTWRPISIVITGILSSSFVLNAREVKGSCMAEELVCQFMDAVS